ncbi:hypothetical protein KCP70_19590 [Salmonella enterica subsp. enterica]|nr:hypothetical protein KCP70_19590 [Salmonella enterica subsp. enterica]
MNWSILCSSLWQAVEPDNERCALLPLQTRLLCGGEACWPIFADFWRYPSTRADDLLLGWCRQHRPDFFPLAVMAVGALWRMPNMSR